MGRPNCTCWLCVLGGQVEHGLGQAEGKGGDGDAADLECAQELAETHGGIADELVVGNPDVVQVELAGVETTPADPPHLRTHGEAGRVLLDHEAAIPRTLVVGRAGAGQEGDPERHVRPRVGDEALPAVDQPATVPRLGSGADASGIGAGIGLGESERAQHTPLGQGSQPAFPLSVVAEQVQRQGPNGHVRLPRRGHGLVGQPDLLHGGDEADRGHADPAPLLGDEHPEQAQSAHLTEQIGGTAPLVPRQGGAWRDLLQGEVAAEADEVTF